MEGTPLPQDFDIRAWISKLVGGDTAELVRGDIAYAIARSLNCMHFHRGQLRQYLG